MRRTEGGGPCNTGRPTVPAFPASQRKGSLQPAGTLRDSLRKRHGRAVRTRGLSNECLDLPRKQAPVTSARFYHRAARLVHRDILSRPSLFAKADGESRRERARQGQTETGSARTAPGHVPCREPARRRGPIWREPSRRQLVAGTRDSKACPAPPSPRLTRATDMENRRQPLPRAARLRSPPGRRCATP